MQQLRRFSFFDRSIVERSRYLHSPHDVSVVSSRPRDSTTTSTPCEAAKEKPGGKTPMPDAAGPLEDLKNRQGTLKYKCYSTTQVDNKGHPVLLREAGLFSKLPEQVVTSSDINKNFTMLAV
ncbi:hypothetical protein Emag_004869 [Eimeria magna]